MLTYTRPCRFGLAVLLVAGSTSAIAQSQQCDSKQYPSTPTDHFTIHGDGTVTHTMTGLMWKVCSEGMNWNQEDNSCTYDGSSDSVFNWSDALNTATQVNSAGGFAGYADWRLPNIKELLSIVEIRCRAPRFNEDVFKDPDIGSGTSEYYWTSTPAAGADAWSVSFFDDISVELTNEGAGVVKYVPRTNLWSLRLVRDTALE